MPCLSWWPPILSLIKNEGIINGLGFLEREIKKDQIPMLDTGENPDAPLPREMIDLEVGRRPAGGNETLSGDFREIGERTAGGEPERGDTEEELLGTDRTETHPT